MQVQGKANFLCANQMDTPKPSSTSPQYHQYFRLEDPERKKSWNERAICYLNNFDSKLDEKMPNFEIQNKIDHIGHLIEKKFAPLKKFNDWLDSNGQGQWYKKLATFLAKLPARAVRNIIRLLFNIIKGIIYTAVHPLKSLNNIAKMLVNLAHELTKPETWSKIGVGMVGASVGQALVTGNPLSVIGLGIGFALLAAGLTVGAIKSAVQAEEGLKLKAAGKNLLFQAKQLPEAALTGFCMGLILGGIQKAAYNHEMKSFKVTNYQDAKQYADTFIKDHNLPTYTDVQVDASGKIVIKWTGNEFNQLKQMNPLLQDNPLGNHAVFAKIELLPDSADFIIRYRGFDGFEGYNYNAHLPINGGMLGKMYPTPPPNMQFSQYGPLGGASSVFNSTIKKD